MGWRSWLRASPFRIAAATVVVTLVLAGAAASAGYVAILSQQGCNPVQYAPQTEFSFSEQSYHDGIGVTVTMEGGDRVSADHLFLVTDRWNRSWAALDDVANASTLVEPGANVQLPSLAGGDDVALLYTPGPAFDPAVDSGDCSGSVGRVRLGGTTAGGERNV